MSLLLFLGVAVVGGLGATCRLVLDGIIRSRTRGGLPWGTIIINVTGSFLLGLVTGITTAHLLSDTAAMVLGVGFLGGYTTFSTASFETVRLLQERRWMAGTINAFGTLFVTTAVAGAGVWIGGFT